MFLKALICSFSFHILDCTTVGVRECKFPFKYKNHYYYTCTKAGYSDGPYKWCSKQNNATGHMKMWGHCTSECEKGKFLSRDSLEEPATCWLKKL